MWIQVDGVDRGRSKVKGVAKDYRKAAGVRSLAERIFVGEVCQRNEVDKFLNFAPHRPRNIGRSPSNLARMFPRPQYSGSSLQYIPRRSKLLFAHGNAQTRETRVDDLILQLIKIYLILKQKNYVATSIMD